MELNSSERNTFSDLQLDFLPFLCQQTNSTLSNPFEDANYFTLLMLDPKQAITLKFNFNFNFHCPIIN